MEKREIQHHSKSVQQKKKKSVPLLSWPAPSVTPKKRATFSPQTL